jgi:GNAT superfamily N-acetyltransferase
VRRATPADIAELARLRWDFSADEAAAWGGGYAEYARGFAAFADRALAGGGWVVWVAEFGPRLVGNVWVQRVDKVPRPGLFDGCWGYVTNVYVDEPFRDLGVGSRLLDAAVAAAKEAGWELLLVWPSERSVPFYRRVGFAPPPEALELMLAP